MADHVSRLAAADADFEAREDIAAEVFDDGFDAIMASGGAFFAETQGSEWQGRIVVDDEHLLWSPLVKREDLADGATAQIHESLRFDQQRAVVGKFGQMALPLGCGLKRHGGCRCHAIHHHEPDVVAGVFILTPGVA